MVEYRPNPLAHNETLVDCSVIQKNCLIDQNGHLEGHGLSMLNDIHISYNVNMFNTVVRKTLPGWIGEY